MNKIEKKCEVCNQIVGGVNEAQYKSNWYEHETLSEKHKDYLKLKNVSIAVLQDN